VRESPARAEPHDATAWLPLHDFAALPPLDRLLIPDPEIEHAAPRDTPVGVPSPARAEPHDATAWLPLPELEELPSVDALLAPDPTVEPAAPREVPVGVPSPARAEPHDATAWLPLPELDPVPVGDGNGGGPPTRGHRRTRRFHVPYRALLTMMAVAGTCAAIYVGVTVLLDKGADVTILVDGRTISTETKVATVADVLEDEGVQLGEYDRAVPDASTPVENELSVKVLRAFTVPVAFDGTPTTIQTTYREAGDGFIEDATEQLSPDARIGFLDPPKRITDSTPVVVNTFKSGVLLVDGRTVEYDSPAHTVREMLADNGITLAAGDVTRPPGLDDVLVPMNSDGSRVAIALIRVQNETIELVEAYSLPDQFQADATMDVTAPYRLVPGKAGTQVVTYVLTHENGVATGQVPVAWAPIDVAVPNITYYGTKYNPRWDKIAQCETGNDKDGLPYGPMGNWDHTGSGNRGPNTYQGGTGIWSGNWDSYRNEIIAEGLWGGAEAWPKDANEATKWQQIIVAERIKDDHGWGAWGCGKTLGYAKEDGKRTV
jgi:uncharacterized protein YabE (DUF348 family)